MGLRWCRLGAAGLREERLNREDGHRGGLLRGVALMIDQLEQHRRRCHGHDEVDQSAHVGLGQPEPGHAQCDAHLGAVLG